MNANNNYHYLQMNFFCLNRQYNNYNGLSLRESLQPVCIQSVFAQFALCIISGIVFSEVYLLANEFSVLACGASLVSGEEMTVYVWYIKVC